ncbi:pyridoxamine 5'-phosphate oxidase family protein [Parabacteroides sp. PF5-9]|uniref:pyridoxamine 5'-phosphate oxidase family protein n=1 Tax=Parabacteroides sp. PF5-9 TaxID=1742404 RepID=UPI002476F456|nr:pyridoxamine 5'-phosphate oxidase family protein [Parabacteroides sp. PF5-9]MDH6357608.1 nitroimidazol reductase NimA-like FMN-containing flavoprotein (pyridoxamine 5'-phosphate oxidase superfamily) [Parabacteroides sp. PF5-9]
MFEEVRRKDRLLGHEEAIKLLEIGEYGFLAMAGKNGYGYGIPINFVKDRDALYFHCAPEGYKLESIKENPCVSFCVVGRTHVLSGKFTTEYESVIVFGKMQLDLSKEERLRALRLLVQKYSPTFTAVGEKYIAGSFHRTAVMRLDIQHLSGKSKRDNEKISTI